MSAASISLCDVGATASGLVLLPFVKVQKLEFVESGFIWPLVASRAPAAMRNGAISGEIWSVGATGFLFRLDTDGFIVFDC